MHTLIVGISGSGKTTLAKLIARQNPTSKVSIYDPNASAGWPAASLKIADAEIFLAQAPRMAQSLVLIDEAKTLWDADANKADELVYRGRHRGLALVLIAQRTRMVPPNARNQCTRVWSFRQQVTDAQILADEYHEGFLACSSFQPFEFGYSDGFTFIRGKICANGSLLWAHQQ